MEFESTSKENYDPPEMHVQKPFVGMEFESMKEARECYVAYGKHNGFWIRTRTSVKANSRSNDVTAVLYVCSRQGKVDVNNEMENGENVKTRTCSTIKCDCSAQMRVKVDRSTLRWKVVSFSDEHNHNLITPTKRVKMKSYRNMPKPIKDLTETFHRENLVVGKVPSIFGGDQIGFDNRDCYNHLAKVRRNQLGNGDAQSVLTYFRKRQAQNPQFYYAVQCDEDGRATNFFWVDSRSRMAYRYFGDVVTFDTTYRTNKYDMPFAPFTGVNHHFQTIQFGCALLQDETEETFLWLFDTWLEAMGGHHPISIITDQDPAMKLAISKVFPNSRHRLCLWHIQKKFAEKLARVYFSKSDFKKRMKRCIHGTYTEEDFEEQWNKLLLDFDLGDNLWLRHLYDIRVSWVPIYNRATFFAGMNTTGRSEGMNSFFDDFVTPRTNLREFVVRYEEALKKLVKNEMDEDYCSEHKNRVVAKREFILSHASDVYTRNIFKKFKEEWDMVYMFRCEDEDIGNEGKHFHVRTRESVDAHQEHFVVVFNTQNHIGNCSCKHFELFGMICRHLMKVFLKLDLERIPNHFLLQRWKKSANHYRVMDSGPLLTKDDSEHAEIVRLNHMCQEATKLACIAAPHHEAYLIYMNGLKELSDRIDTIIISAKSNHLVVEGEASQGVPNDNVESQSKNMFSETLLYDPNISQTKGRKKDAKGKEGVVHSGRFKPSIELAAAKRKRMCKTCGKLARHDTRNCRLNPNKRKKNIVLNDDDDLEDDENEDDMEMNED